jgi:protein TonB
VSVVVHGLLATALIVIPLLMGDALPAPNEALRAFLVSPPQVVTPPPPPASPSVAGRRLHNPERAPRVPQAAKFVAPIEMPEEIIGDDPLELGVEGGISGGVEGGVPGGVVGGIVGGLPEVAAPAPHPQVVRVGETIRAPTLLHKVPPVYPRQALKAHVSGSVILEAHVDVRGRVKSVKVLRGHPLFDEAAIAAVKQWRYMPALHNGQPTELLLTVTLIFKLAPPQK